MLLNTTFRQITINTYAFTKQGNKEKQKLHIEGKKSTKLALTLNLNNITKT